MTSRAPITFRHIITRPFRSTPVDRSLQTFPPERYSDLVRRRGGLISVPGKAAGARENTIIGSGAPQNKLTKLLLNVNIERSLGPVQVIMAPENTVGDLIKAAIEIYVKEKRRPLLKYANPDCFQLHYSQFSLESLKPDEKLINLGSRNFFLCSSSNSINSSCLEKAKLANKSAFPFIKLMDVLL
ncbi:uncharacterized protein LOC8272442 [Ricinus communis]|uniref:DUF7054 domain-containing protein n=1 Tax=Ricinus communis TaxID=3988 RepID=B9RBU2_RICCO|nr:uncharacterized protein LOC8272442 [Ricinus communis]EEF51013.1 conserved hypothetical protein [Ricinus communis]|eukprot:XP_002509626.1 uncharacterized protein LOC8272442 [Ricinus communis]